MIFLSLLSAQIFSSLKVFIVTFAISSVFEILALNTRVNIFGSTYRYDLKKTLFRFHILNLPICIPFLWAITKVLIPSFFGFIWIDLIVDPLAIKAGWWKFNRKGLWFGVPLTNYIGWAIVWLTVEVINAKVF